MADLSDLLSEISPDAPCGENLEYDSARIALDTNIQGTPENQFTGENAQPPNWRDIQKDSIALLHRTKDLQVILYLIRALIPTEGIKGFRDGLSLLEQSLSLFWEQIHPQLDPDDDLDPTLRVNILEELVNSEYILQPLSHAMLVVSKSVGCFSLRDIQYASDKLPTPEHLNRPEINTIKAAFLDVAPEEISETYQAITEAITATAGIETFVGGQVGSTNGPNLEALQSLLKELRFNVEEFAESKLSGGGEDEQAGEAAEDSTSARPAKGQAFAGGKITSRHEVIKALEAICTYYKEYEPSSPVPVLLERAKYLVTADFLSIVKNMMPDALGQLELIKGPDPDASSDY
ncbi:MAG: type VI secretion system protein TssA [Gammaproteobacteria bacterium]